MIENLDIGYAGEGWKETVVGDIIIFVKIDYDSAPENPLECWEGSGSIKSFSHRHSNSVRSQEEAEELVANPNAVILSYFEHGMCSWGVAGTMSGTPDFRWDGVEVAGVWLPDETLIEELKGMITEEERRAALLKWAEQACEVYTDWCNGSVYGYQIEAYELKRDNGEDLTDYRDYKHEQILEEDSCWGFYGHKSVEEEAEVAAGWILKAALKELEQDRFMAETICSE